VELSFRFGRPGGTEAKEGNGGPARPRQAPSRPRKTENMKILFSVARVYRGFGIASPGRSQSGSQDRVQDPRGSVLTGFARI
jgi:hypothetical protein